MTAAGQTVRLSTALRDLDVTDQVGDLSWRKVIPGGFASATITLERPLSLTPEELQYYGTLYVYDGRTSEVVWEGRIEDLGRGSDTNGQIWSVNALGPMAHAHDDLRVLIYQDIATGSWTQAADAPGWLQTQQVNTAAFGPGIQMLAPRDTVIGVGSYPAWEYRLLSDNDLNLAVISLRYGEDDTDANFAWQFQVLPIGTLTVALTHPFASSSSNTFALISTNFAAGEQLIRLNLVRSSTTATVASDSMGASFVTITICSTLFTKAGAEITLGAAYNGVPLTASKIVADLLGRMLPKFDGANAVIDTSTDYVFAEQCAYPDGADADQVLTDLMTLLPTMYWAAWESNDAGRHRFEWKPLPTEVRYIVDADDGFQASNTAGDLYDKVAVRWIDAAGVTQTTIRTLANPILDNAGLHRTSRLDLGTPIGGETAAIQAGDQFLLAHATPPNAGTLRIARPIYDAVARCNVQPWEIQPGELILVRDIQATTDDLNSGRDGVTRFRIVAIDHSTSDNSSSLELDSPAINLGNFINAAAAQAAAILRR